MLWWFIGFWLASGAVLPAFLLLRMAYQWLATPKLGPKGLHVLSGLVGIGIGAMILWIVCSFSNSSSAVRDTPSAFVLAQPPMTLAVVAAVRPIQLLPTDAPPPTTPLHSKLAAERGPAHRYTVGTSVRSYVTWSSSRGVWLFGPNGNEGANN